MSCVCVPSLLCPSLFPTLSSFMIYVLGVSTSSSCRHDFVFHALLIIFLWLSCCSSETTLPSLTVRFVVDTKCHVKKGTTRKVPRISVTGTRRLVLFVNQS
ncbi:hypothetical protein BDP55DRAFT_645288 [Colletotrichum godetiae]|uniref:Uncharacterized protein n=1 Tax=Colletotrichum godetiae TaxID=1209918 RepID=A0AAJ0B1E7_9PEZI|nr:uncharacterized protein BDP55DRAFT_645288 [Colletotrichum godetiae]KAK1699907.1 hypothetical protein BDP55DRAFT_645288 [Colletotrichum godetiae]